ncbi:kelch-like protein 5 [Alligator mississippiensis]|uniref:Kelch-like protein 5 n=1 Tax=Alligator mississippiensis TaxID=8496 RepID=A0A151NGJ1_ALLMI|nr:kelch-like protein 5 [Alligator mississippiensis]
MYQGLKHLYQARQLCDVTLVAEGKHFPCHRMLLASVSLYFRSMFTSNFRESRDGEIVLQSVAPSTLESVLNYLYTGEISLSSETAEDLFVAASWLQIHPLEETVSRFLQENISTENCFRLCALADIHNHQALLFVATHYIMQEFERLSEEEDFLHLDANILSRIISSDNLTVASELVVCQAVQRWVKFQPAQRLPQQDKLMGHVRFHLMSDAELAEVAHCADVEIPKRQLKGEDGQWEVGGNKGLEKAEEGEMDEVQAREEFERKQRWRGGKRPTERRELRRYGAWQSTPQEKGPAEERGGCPWLSLWTTLIPALALKACVMCGCLVLLVRQRCEEHKILRQTSTEWHCVLETPESKEFPAQLGRQERSYYIGLSSQKVEGQWHWVDQTPYNQATTFWRPKEPSFLDNETCTVFHMDINQQGNRNWKNNPCTHDFYRICETTAANI